MQKPMATFSSRLPPLTTNGPTQFCYAPFFGPLQLKLYSAFLKCASGTAFNALPTLRKKDISTFFLG
jgi:hypothetical protein